MAVPVMKNWYFQNSVMLVSKAGNSKIAIIITIIRVNQILKNPESSKFPLARP